MHERSTVGGVKSSILSSNAGGSMVLATLFTSAHCCCFGAQMKISGDKLLEPFSMFSSSSSSFSSSSSSSSSCSSLLVLSSEQEELLIAFGKAKSKSGDSDLTSRLAVSNTMNTCNLSKVIELNVNSEHQLIASQISSVHTLDTILGIWHIRAK